METNPNQGWTFGLTEENSLDFGQKKKRKKKDKYQHPVWNFLYFVDHPTINRNVIYGPSQKFGAHP